MKLHKPMIVGVSSALLIAVLILIGGTGLAQDGDPTPPPTLIPAVSPSADWPPIVRDFDGIPFVYVPAGCFMMGSTEEQIDGAFQMCEDTRGEGECNRSWLEREAPAHEVCLSAFWIGQTEVTHAQYRACVDAIVCRPPINTQYYDDPAYADHPVVFMDWHQASAYAAWIGGSLPSEAQWEYAARGPEAWVFPWGDGAPTIDRANVWISLEEYVVGTSPVGTYPDGASWVGALDMTGNVWEWAADWYDENYYVTLVDGVLDPTGPASSGDDAERVIRGGGWGFDPVLARAACRHGCDPTEWSLFRGFRVVLSGPLP